jgi:integrase
MTGLDRWHPLVLFEGPRPMIPIIVERDLTSDNSLLSGVTSGTSETIPPSATECIDVVDEVGDYVRQSLAPATLRAYRADLDHFEAWGGSIPSTDVQIASYLAAHAEALAVATLVRRLASISQAHAILGVTSPTGSALVRATMRGIRRVRGSAQRQAKPLLRDDLFLVLDRMGDDIRAVRDRALLLLGFAGGFRRSELTALDCKDIEAVRQGLVIHLRRSKTDQEGAGREIGVPLGRTRWCPVAVVTNWLDAAAITDGPVFRPVDRHGNVGADRLSGEAVCLVVRERVAAAGFDPTGFSGHSLRAGFATSAAQAGVSTLKIRAQTGHASDAMLARYVRDGELFVGNAAGVLL